jgi:hypothetical protein|tara:strand:- start:3148 stop:3594 length:447 start_codon:yes stop_codon:yes gene_type:complete
MADKKSATIFDFIDGMTHKKKEWHSYTDIDHKKFSPFIVNRWLSMRMELIDIINELQKYTIGLLSPRDTYRLYHGFLPAQRTFAKYIKGKKEDKFNKQLVSIIANHYQVSKFEAIDYIDLLDKDSCADLLTLYGHTPAEKKKLLKGVK